MSEREKELEDMLHDAAQEILNHRREKEALSHLLEVLRQAQAHQDMEILKLLSRNTELEVLLRSSDEKMIEAITIVKDMNVSMSDMREKLQETLAKTREGASEPTIAEEIDADE